MELKQFRLDNTSDKVRLLIVPYGIETILCVWLSSWHFLLIVPYGIETVSASKVEFLRTSFNRTLWNWNFCPELSPIYPFGLLIVPYGIETPIPLYGWVSYILLIVPYGIETRLRLHIRLFLLLLIVPYGIETSLALNVISPLVLLIVPYGIETPVGRRPK